LLQLVEGRLHHAQSGPVGLVRQMAEEDQHLC
jgi:hypothetical protein